jgi:hypothetical protein
MSEAVVDDIVAVLPPLLQSLEALGFIARHLNPPDFDAVMEAAGSPDRALGAVRARLAGWPEPFTGVQTSLQEASDQTLAAFEGLRAVQHGQGDLIAVFRALRRAVRAQEALYPLAARLPPVSDFFLDPELRDDADLKPASPGRQPTTPGSSTSATHPAAAAASRSMCRNIITPSAWPLVRPCMAAAATGAPSCGAGCATRAAAVPSWSRRPRPAKPGR